MIRLAVILFIAFSVNSLAQTSPVAAPQALKVGNVILTGSFRTRAEVWDWFQPASGDKSYTFAGSILRISLSQVKGKLDWNAEITAPFVLGLPPNPVGPGAQGALGLGGNYFAANDRRRNPAMIFPKQLYVRFSQLGASQAHSVRIGRFEFADGGEVTPANASLAAIKRDRVNQRLLGNFTFAHVGRSFDGVQYGFTKPSGNLTFLAAVPTRGVFQVDGWGWNKVAFAYASFTRPWNTDKTSAEARLLTLYYDDWRGGLKSDNRALTARRADQRNIRVGTFGGHLVDSVRTKAGSVDSMLWVVAQTGRWGVQDHRAYAVDVEAGIQPNVLPAVKPWLRAGFYYGSGDGDPNDDRHETFFQVLPSPRSFARIPFFNMMNNTDVFGILILRPHTKLTTSTEFHGLRISNANDLWYSGGGVFQPWTFGYTGRDGGGSRSLANLFDTSVEYRLSPRVTFSSYAGYIQSRTVVHATYPAGNEAGFGYVELLYRF